MRKSHDEQILVFCNFTPVPRHNYQVGLHQQGAWKQILNSDETKYGGTGHYLAKEAIFTEHSYEGTHLTVTIPPLGAIIFKKEP
jgi:1,4-alpha-glucan branching enzyme